MAGPCPLQLGPEAVTDDPVEPLVRDFHPERLLEPALRLDIPIGKPVLPQPRLERLVHVVRQRLLLRGRGSLPDPEQLLDPLAFIDPEPVLDRVPMDTKVPGPCSSPRRCGSAAADVPGAGPARPGSPSTAF